VTLRVLLVDDHPLYREGLATALLAVPDVQVVGEAGDGEAAVARAAELQPDVVVMDLGMPVIDGAEATRRVLALDVAPTALVLTSSSESQQILAALRAGAQGYLLKDAAPETLLKGIRDAARGDAPLASAAITALLDNHVREPARPHLTPREHDILSLLAEGLGNKQIARQLGLSVKTIKNNLTTVFQRIGVADRVQAALWAERHGIVARPRVRV